MAKGKRKVVVRITSDVKGLKKGIFEADLTLKNFAKTSRAAANVAGKALATGAAAAATALAAIYAKTAPLIAQQKDFAEQLGLTYDELTGLGYAAEVFGSDAATFNSAIDRMQRRVGLAAKDTGAAKNALKELGFEATELAKLKTDEQFKTIADRIAAVDDRAAQAAFAFEIFGNQGQALLTMINSGSEAMEKQAEQARRLGVALSDVDAQKVADADEAMMKASKAVEGVFNRITVQLAPAVEFLAEQFVQLADDSEGFEKEIGQGFEGVVKAAGFAGDALRGMQVIWKGLVIAAQGASLAAVTALRSLVQPFDVILGGINKRLNNLILVSNTLAGTDFKFLDTTPFGDALGVLDGMSQGLIENLRLTKKELHELLMEELPSEQADRLIEQLYAAGDEAAGKVREAGGGSNGEGGGGVLTTDAQKKEMEAFRQSLLTKEQAEIESYEKRLEQFAEYADVLYETEAERKAAKEQLEADHQAKLTELARQGELSREGMAKLSWQKQAKFAADTFVELTQGAAQHNRKMFEINKAAGIAQTTMYTYEAAMGAYKALAPIPIIGPALGAAAAATAIAAGMANIQAIRSSSFGGGGAPSQAPTPSTPVHETGGGGRSSSGSVGGQDLVLHMRGEVFGRETVLGLIEGINSALDDGAQLRGIRVSG